MAQFSEDPQTLTISKTDFKLYLEAPRHLWAIKHGHSLPPMDAMGGLLSKQGYQVESLGRAYLQQQYLEKVQEMRWQETFSLGRFTARVDALMPVGDGWALVEIKSSTKVDKDDLDDVAFQAMVLAGNLPVSRFFVLHLNKDYIRTGALELESLFVLEDVTEDVRAVLPAIADLAAGAKAAAESADHHGAPGCLVPKDCPFPELCHPNLPEYSIFDLPSISPKQKMAYIAEGKIDIRTIDLPGKLTDKQLTVARAMQTREPLIAMCEIQRFLDGLAWPLYFLDYETCIHAIPSHEGFSPQQDIVFQYSLHTLYTDGRLEHCQFLDLDGEDPTQRLTTALMVDIGTEGSILTWNKRFEMRQNARMGERHPQYAAFYADLNDRIIDLGDVVSKSWLVYPEFRGSWSLKKVLPVLAPHLSYAEMPINEGGKASEAWWRCAYEAITTSERAGLEEQLLAYCHLDTLAMVEIYQVLRKLTQ